MVILAKWVSIYFNISEIQVGTIKVQRKILEQFWELIFLHVGTLIHDWLGQYICAKISQIYRLEYMLSP